MKKTLFFTRAIYKLLATILLCFLPGFLYSQESDYREIFGEHYREAVAYFNQNPWIDKTLTANAIDPHFVKAIVFPELVRYSYLKDRIEVQALKTLYVQYGQNYANFSVGRFQIKPSFAEKIEKDVFHGSLSHQAKLKEIDTAATPKARLDRVRRLDNPEWQLQYLIWFLKVMEMKYGKQFANLSGSKLKFYATAYNCGYFLPKEKIEAMAKLKLFHTSLISSSIKYNYSSISCHYWNYCK